MSSKKSFSLYLLAGQRSAAWHVRLNQCRIVVCKARQFAVMPSQIQARLSRHHPGIAPGTQQPLAHQCCHLEDVARANLHPQLHLPLESLYE